jgi:transcriptional regulator with XRE-family HTH domain
MPLCLRVRHLAHARGIRTLSEFSRASGLGLSTARRVWYSTASGKRGGAPLSMLSFDLLERLAAFFDVPVGELFDVVEGGGAEGAAGTTGARGRR